MPCAYIVTNLTSSLTMPTRNAVRSALALFCVFVGFYLLTYNGRIESGDTYTLFDITDSLAQYGDTLLDRSAWFNQPDPIGEVTALPLSSAGVESLQPLLAVPLYWLATILPGVGLVHAVWLFNVFVSAATVVLLYAYALLRGSDRPSALFVSVMLGACTIVWPYSKTFFREPLAAFLLLSAGYFLERWRQRRSWFSPDLVLAVVSAAAALLTKDALLLALPALACVAFPLRFGGPQSRLKVQRLIGALLVACVILLVALFVIFVTVPQVQLQAVARQIATVVGFNIRNARIWPTAVHSYLFSLGGSIWGTSPVLLLALAGMVLLFRRNSFRYVVLVPILILPFVFGYAALRDVHWFGGLSWPPRFMVPVVPFLMLVAAPAVQSILSSRHRRWFLVGLVALIAYSTFIQLTSVSLGWGAYASALPPESTGLLEWRDGLNRIEFLRWVVIPSLWNRVPFDFAWVRASVPLWPVVCLALMALGLVAFFRRGGDRSDRFAVPGLGLVLIATPWLLLMTLGGDSFYLGDNPSLAALPRLLSERVRAGDIVLLADDNYLPFVLNEVSHPEPRIIALPDPPGEQPSPEQPPRARASNPASLLEKETVVLIQKLALSRPRIWLLADSGPWIPWSVRPVERFLSSTYYPVAEYSFDPPDPRLRLIEFSTDLAPDPFAYQGADFATDFQFGESIVLQGFSLPDGKEYAPGDVMAVSLLWQTDQKLDANYTVALFLTPDQGDVPVAQGFDSQPAWGFAPTTTWLPGMPVWDNRTIRLPSNLAPGAYRIWVRLYQSDDSLMILPVAGTRTRPDGIAVLPLSVDIHAGQD